MGSVPSMNSSSKHKKRGLLKLERDKQVGTYIVHATGITRRRPRSDSSLLGQCLRLVSYATGVLPHLRLRAFNRRSTLPSLCYRTGGNSVAAL